MLAGAFILVAVVGYLLGNINGAILVSRLLLKEDVRTHGSGNAGLTNFFRSYGGAATLMVLFIDVAKTVAAALLGGWVLGRFGCGELGRMLGGAFTVLGHLFPAVFQFRGGKGALCSGALAAVMDWRVLVVVLGVFLVAVVLTRYVSLGSCLGAVAYVPAFAWRFPQNWPILGIALALAVASLVMHRKNIQRLLKGKENKLSFHHHTK